MRCMSRRVRRPHAKRWILIAQLFAIEADIRGRSLRNAATPSTYSLPILAELKQFLDTTLAKISGKSSLARLSATQPHADRLDALHRRCRLEMTNNAAERAMRR